MGINTNWWNKIRYTFYAPGYDLIARYFKDSRRNSISALNIKSGDRVLIVGAGTGLDLEFLPHDCEIIATDITPSMIAKVKKRNTTLNKNVEAKVMDGQALSFEDSSFDFIILHLILAVVPNPELCIKESERVLKQGGQIAVFDKFVHKNKAVSLMRRMVNFFTNFLATDITRDLESIVGKTKLEIITDVPADFNGHFRMAKLIKPKP